MFQPSSVFVFFLLADTLTTIKIWNALLFTPKSRPEWEHSVHETAHIIFLFPLLPVQFVFDWSEL